MQTIEQILQYLEKKDTNIRSIAKDTGISSDKLYSWRAGRGTPKAEDTKTLLEWAKKRLPQDNTTDEIQTNVEEMQNGKNYQDKYIALLERTSELQQERITLLLKSNSDLMQQLQTNLESLTRNHLTSHAMNEAFHEEIVDLLLQVSKQPASVKMTLIENVHNKGVEKMLDYSERGILIDSHS